MPVTPARNSAAFTSGRRSGRTIVVMSFMDPKLAQVLPAVNGNVHYLQQMTDIHKHKRIIAAYRSLNCAYYARCEPRNAGPAQPASLAGTASGPGPAQLTHEGVPMRAVTRFLAALSVLLIVTM